jgi:hypothetical protein
MPPQALIAPVAASSFANYFPLDVLVRDLQGITEKSGDHDE